MNAVHEMRGTSLALHDGSDEPILDPARRGREVGATSCLDPHALTTLQDDRSRTSAWLLGPKRASLSSG